MFVKSVVTVILSVVAACNLSAQKLDSIYFNLYTDSLKKGTYNYINVEGKYSDGRYLPLSNKELKFSSSHGKFDGNSLFIDSSFKEEKVTVKAMVIANNNLKQEIVIYIKKYETTERLPTAQEVLGGQTPKRKRKSRK
jgi:hypothetical protein